MAKKAAARKDKGKEVLVEGEDSATVTSDVTPDDPVEVNIANLIELKRATDDYIKEFYAKSYNASHRHEDVHLLLGWTSSIAAIGASIYAWYIPFKQSKNWVAVGTIVYFVLTGLLWIWTKYVVQDSIFVGKRKTFANRIGTETLIVQSKILPQPDSNPPLQLTLKYAHSTNNGKSLINSADTTHTLSFGDIFDSEGTLHKQVLGDLLTRLEGDLTKTL